MFDYFEKSIPLYFELGFNETAVEKLKKYVQLLWTSNSELNLFSRKMTFPELIDNHVLDSLLALKYFPQGVKNVADLGSGGGLPGIILAIQYPNIQMHLFEKSPKKTEFLKRCEFVKNLHFRSDITKDLDQMDLVVARAFKPLDVILAMTNIYFKNGGRYFLYKGRKEKAEAEIALAKKTFKSLSCQVIELKSPRLDVERHLVVINV